MKMILNLNFTNVFKYILICFSLTIIFSSSQAQAHKIMVFGWVEGEKIMVRGGFGGNRAIIGADVTLVDQDNQLICKGKTNDQGIFCCSPENFPTKYVLITLDTGAGHKGTWTLYEEDLGITSANYNNQESNQKQKSMLQNQKMDEGPSLSKIFIGIGIILICFFIFRWFRKSITPKKTL